MALKYKFDISYKTFNEYLIGDKIKEDAAKNAHTFAGTSSDFMKNEMVSTNWITNILHQLKFVYPENV
jgi:hypothetical protein